MRVNLLISEDVRLAADEKIATLNRRQGSRSLNLSRQIETLLRDWLQDEGQDGRRHNSTSRA